jgi:ppGpp synthetase/RelA/SpoT-type nucleotidyltranferase
MKQPKLSAATLKLIDRLVKHYVANQQAFTMLLDTLKIHVETSKNLAALTHSVKWRVKDPDHLRAKLIRKGLQAKSLGQSFPYTLENLFRKINDLAGFRILHLHTKQIKEINNELQAIFDEQRWVKLEGPEARTWDDESRKYFDDIGVKTENSETMYTSVHYVVQANTKSEITCEIQVRTLMEEVWGEVDHTINYPEKSKSLSCREQIKVLARVTSSCSRLVDSIFLANQESQTNQTQTTRSSVRSIKQTRKQKSVKPG